MNKFEKNKNGDVKIMDKHAVLNKNITVSGDLSAVNDLTIDGGTIVVSGDVNVKGTLTLIKGSLLIGGYLFTPRRVVNRGCSIKELYEEEENTPNDSKLHAKRLLRK